MAIALQSMGPHDAFGGSITCNNGVLRDLWNSELNKFEELDQRHSLLSRSAWANVPKRAAAICDAPPTPQIAPATLDPRASTTSWYNDGV